MNSTEYTPNEDHLEYAYLERETAHNKARGKEFHQSLKELESEFDRAIARIRAEAKVAALREAAQEAWEAYVDGIAPTLNYRLWQMLRDRADRIEKETHS